MSMSKSNEQKENVLKTPWTDEQKEQLIKLYPSHSNRELCEILQKTDGQLRGMKAKLHLNTKFSSFSESEKQIIREWYYNHPNEMDLSYLSNKMNRSKNSISRFARREGLTKVNRPQTSEAKEKSKKSNKKFRETDRYLQEILPKQKKILAFYARKKHPRGMLNKHHSKETRDQMSKSHIELSKVTPLVVKHEIAMKAVKTKRKNGSFGTTSNTYSRCKRGKREDLNNIFFRSAWEANFARVLNLLKIQWEYEIKRFDYPEEKERVLSYQPDFYLPEYDIWVEIKGWMDDKSRKRLELFKKYYPEETLVLIASDRYKELEKIYSKKIINWE